VSVEIIRADTPEGIAAIRALFREYAEAIGFSLDFQGFDDELAGLPGRYAPPAGRLLIARIGGEIGGKIAGGVGLRALGHGICEMKRLYVRPGFRGHRAGRRLAEAIIDEARAIGYHSMRLDTADRMTEANALYRTLGFAEIPAYCENPLPDARYFELRLDNNPGAKEGP
jgi:putative acetyltransferase